MTVFAFIRICIANARLALKHKRINSYVQLQQYGTIYFIVITIFSFELKDINYENVLNERVFVSIF
jgi:hypothetical protein